MGAGRSEIMRAIFGVDKYDSGEVLVDGKKLHGGNPASAISAGIGFCTEDRKKEGLALRLSILLNMTLVRLPLLSKLGVIQRKAQRAAADEYMKSISIKAPSVNQLVGNLSGGNQQKVVVAKWLMMTPRCSSWMSPPGASTWVPSRKSTAAQRPGQAGNGHHRGLLRDRRDHGCLRQRGHHL